MSKTPPPFDIYLSNTKIQNALCPLCGGKKFRISARLNGEFDIDCRGRKVFKYNSDFAIMEWQHNYCPWTIRLSKGDFIRAAIAKADVNAKLAIAARGKDREKISAAREVEEENERFRQEQKREARRERERLAGETKLDGEERIGGEWEEEELR